MSHSSFLADNLVRAEILDPGQSFHLEAPAGSGKTRQLVARFLTLLAAVNQPQEILVLTFNRKAAGEVKERLFNLLHQARRNPPPAPKTAPEPDLDTLAYRAWQAHAGQPEVLLTPDSLPVMTFHGFCHQLLRQAPYEAQIPPGIALLDGEEQDWLQHEAVEQLRRRVLELSPTAPLRQALVNRLLRLDNSWPRLARELAGLIARRDSLKDFLKLARLSLNLPEYQEIMRERLEFLVRLDLQKLQGSFARTELGHLWPGFWAALHAAGADAAHQLPAQLPGPHLDELPAWQTIARTLLTNDGKPRKSLGPSHGFYSGFKKTEWAALIQALPPEACDWLHRCRDWSLVAASPGEVAALHDLVLLVGEAIAAYESLCRERGVIDFVALEQAALQMFTTHDPTEIMLRWDQRLKHVLVDEFQDTSENQYDLLCRLIAGWQPGEGRSLFVVGDPKQSIYGWRKARVQLFVQARQGLPCPESPVFPLTSQRLTTNFRSTASLITWVNDLFARTVMANPDPGLDEVEFHPATPSPEAAPGEVPELAVFFATQENPDPRQAEARWLATQVKESLTTLKTDEKIGILLFARTPLQTYLQALHRSGVLVKVKEGLKLLDDPLVFHLLNLTRALVRPQDDLAWAAVLRAPWHWQELNCLAAIAQEPGDCWWAKLGRYAASPHCCAELSHHFASLEQARQQVGRQPLAHLVVDLLDQGDAWDSIARQGGAAGVANVRAYLELLADAESGLPETTLERLEFVLERAFQPADPQASRSPVEMMTVHAAKGLEFAQVFVPFLDWNPRSRGNRALPPFLLEELPYERKHALALAKPFAHARQSALYERLRELGEGRRLAEARRLFYVAVTRAQENLFLSGVVKSDRQGQLKATPNTPLAWLLCHEEITLSATEVPPQSPSNLRVRVNPVADDLQPGPKAPAVLPEPLDFQPEPVPYQLHHLAASGVFAATADSFPEEIFARSRDEVIRRVLSTLAQGQSMPDVPALAAALKNLGLEETDALRLAQEIRTDLVAAQQEPFLAQALRSDHSQAKTDWRLEDCPQPGQIRQARIDRLFFDGQQWWLVQYVTSRPRAAESESDFLAREAEKYRPQVKVYAEMAARALGLADPEEIQRALYFTSLQKKLHV